MDQIREQIAGARAQVTAAVDGGLTATSAAIASASASACEQYKAAQDRATRFAETGQAHFASSEDMMIEKMKEGVAYAAAHPQYTYPALALAVVVALPGLRTFLVRNTIGQLQSQESAFRGAGSKLKSVQESVSAHGEEFKKLEERAQKAAEEMLRGLGKLRAAGAELRALQGRVEASRATTADLQATLRGLPAQPTLQLRSEAAEAASQLRRTARELDTQLYKILRHGA